MRGMPRRCAISMARLRPGRAVEQPIGRREVLRIERERRHRHAVGADAPRLHRIEVRRRDDERAALAEMLDDRRRERAAFVGIRAGADFVEQDQRRHLQIAIHRDEVRDVRRERAEAVLRSTVRRRCRRRPNGTPAASRRSPAGAGRPAPSTRTAPRSSAPRSCRRCLGPVISSTRLGGSSSTSTGTARSSIGWRAAFSCRLVSIVNSGSMPLTFEL